MTTVASPALTAGEVRTRSSWGSRIALLILFLMIYVGAMFSPPLLDDADSTHAEAAREMYAHHDYVTLKVNGVRYMEKAPLLYWIESLGYHVFGVNEFASRLPNVLAILGLALLAWRWGTRAFGDRAGIYASLFVITGTGFFLFTRITIPDAMLSLLIAAALYFFLAGLEERKAWRWYAGYASVALAVLTKGLVSLVFVGIPAIAYISLAGEWKRWREFRLGTGLLLLIALAAPWHILAGIRNPGFFWLYFINEHVLRFLGKRFPKDYNKLPASLYWLLHMVWLFPWSAYLPLLVRDVRRDLKGASPEDSFAHKTRLLCWILAGTVLIFFAFSTNQEYYTFPAYLPLMMLLAAAIGREEEVYPSRRWLISTGAATAALAMTAGIALLMGLWMSRHHPYVSDIGTVLTHDLSEDTLSMSHALDLSANSFAALRLPAGLAAIALILFPLLSLGLRVRKKHYLATWVTAVGMALFLVAAHLALERFGPYMSSRDLAVAIEQRSKPSDKVMIYGDQAFGSSLLFYLQRPIDLVNGRTTSMWFGSQYPDAPHIFLEDSDLQRAWDSSTRVFLFVPPQNVKKVEELLPQRFTIAESSGKIIYSNQK